MTTTRGIGAHGPSGTWMAREITEQPESLQRSIDALLPLRSALTELLATPDGGLRRVLFAARGSSDNAAIYGRYLLESQAGLSASSAAPSIATHYSPGLPDDRPDLSSALLVSLSQSGATEEIVATQQWAQTRGAATVAVTNHAGSPLARGSGLSLVTQAGEEVAVPATKSYTAQLAAMVVLAIAACDAGGDRDRGDSLAAALQRTPEQASALLTEQHGIRQAAETLQRMPTSLAVGRGLMLGTALEAGLKVEETCLRPVRSYSYADMRHGPVAAVGEGTAALVFAAPDGPLLPAMRELVDDLTSRGAVVIGFGGDTYFAQQCSVHVPTGDPPEALAPVTSIIPAQLTVERLSRALGLDPDSPEGLTKVTRTDRGN